jgi:segregation and condensation protein B
MRMEELEITTEPAAAPEKNAAAVERAAPEEQAAPEARTAAAGQAPEEQASPETLAAPEEQTTAPAAASAAESESAAVAEETAAAGPVAEEEDAAPAKQAAPETLAAPEDQTAAPAAERAAESESAAVAEEAAAEETAADEESAAVEQAAPAAASAAESESAAVAEEAATEETAADEPAAEGEAIGIPLPPEEAAPAHVAISDEQLQAVLEAVVYIAEEPLTLAQMASALGETVDRIETVLRRLIEEFERAEHGIGIREVAGGFKMATKAEHHEAVRHLVKSLKPPLKLSLPALETLAVIAYKQPVTGPEIMQIRGVQGGGVLKTLLDRKLIAGAGRKNVVGKPMLYKTTKEFMIQFGLKDINELPSLKEFEEIRRMAFGETETAAEPVAAPEAQPVAATTGAAPAEPPNEAAPEPVAEAAPAAELNESAAAAEAAPKGPDETEHVKEDAPASEAPPEPEPEA